MWESYRVKRPRHSLLLPGARCDVGSHWGATTEFSRPELPHASRMPDTTTCRHPPRVARHPPHVVDNMRSADDSTGGDTVVGEGRWLSALCGEAAPSPSHDSPASGPLVLGQRLLPPGGTQGPGPGPCHLPASPRFKQSPVTIRRAQGEGRGPETRTADCPPRSGHIAQCPGEGQRVPRHRRPRSRHGVTHGASSLRPARPCPAARQPPAERTALSSRCRGTLGSEAWVLPERGAPCWLGRAWCPSLLVSEQRFLAWERPGAQTSRGCTGPLMGHHHIHWGVQHGPLATWEATWRGTRQGVQG